MPEAKQPVGRPTDYTPELGEQIFALMSQGFSLSAACGKIGIHRQRCYDWEKKHPDFADTIKIAKAARVYVLEEELLKSREGPVTTARIFALKNADPTEWKDKHDVEHSGGVTVEIIKFGGMKPTE